MIADVNEIADQNINEFFTSKTTDYTMSCHIYEVM